MSLAKKLEDDEEDSSAQNDRVAVAIDRFYASASELASSHVAVGLDLIVLHEMPDVALYVKSEGTGLSSEYKIFRGQGMYLSQVELDALSRSGVTQVHIKRTDVQQFTRYIENVLAEIDSISPMADEKKVGLLRTSAVTVMKDIMDAPTPENIQRGVKAVSGFVYVLMRDPKAYGLLLSLSSHDHYTLQHSVGVATNAIILAKKIGIDAEADLIEVGVGGLLHDIGKTKVPKEIINKKGPLDAAEWAEMKKHALYGYEIIKDNPNVGMRAKLAVLQHHEDSMGTGYPLGLKLDQVSLYAKIVAMADIYNALTTDRSYSEAKQPFEAFTLIRDKLLFKVDPQLYEALVQIYGGNFITQLKVRS